jgi:hypothetical protein
MNGTYWRKRGENDECIYIDPSLPVWAQLPNRPGIRECLIATEANEVGTLSRKSTAYHEAAHAVFYELAGVGVEFATAFPIFDERNGWVRGAVKPANAVIQASQVPAYAEGILAADFAQEKAGLGHHDVSSGDFAQLGRLAMQVNTSALAEGRFTGLTAENLYALAAPQVKLKIDDPPVWSAIEKLAARLEESEVVQGDEVREIVARCCPTFAKAA